jgi:energy-coupling factor transporter ATP-binding protein EcfA2/ribosomal protein L17
MDPASAMLLFLLFQATEKVIGYAGGKIADSMTKPLWQALEEKAKWISGKSDTTKRWEAFSQAFAEARIKLENEGRHPEVSKQVAKVLEKFDTTDPSDQDWLSDLSIQLEKASLVSEKPDDYLLVELFTRALSRRKHQPSRAELSETISDFVSVFQDALFAQHAYQEHMFKRAQWEKLRQPHYDTRERYISQIIDYNENLDFVGIPELKDRQALRIEDVFISLQTQVESSDSYSFKESLKGLKKRNIRAHFGDIGPKTRRQLSVNQALAENQKIVILGDPGAGKTTLLKYIVLAFAEDKADKIGLQETRLPIFIRLYDYVSKREECGKEGFSFTDYLNKFCTDHLQLHLPPDFFEQALEHGECCVCFDGLDELGSAGLRREITSAVSSLANRYSRDRFIVTSRMVGYEEAPLNRDEFAHHTVQPLSEDDIKSFVKKWYKARERDAVIRRERAEHLVKTIMGEVRIKSLASNPLMLTIIALVHRVEAELPHERVKLYDKCVTTLVETWDKVRGMKTTLRRRLLEKLAFWMHSQPGENGRTREVREGTLRLQLLQFLQSDPKLQLDEDQMQKEVEDFINLVKSRSGLLIERGEGIYTFSHLTFQEYLASCDIVARFGHSTDAIWNEIQPKLHDTHWREVLLLLLGSLNRFEHHNSILVRRIYESSDKYEAFLHRYLLLAARVLGDRVEIDVKLYNQIIDELFYFLNIDMLAQEDISKSIEQIQGNRRIIDRLITIARGENVDVSVRNTISHLLENQGYVAEARDLLWVIVGDMRARIYERVDAFEKIIDLGQNSVGMMTPFVIGGYDTDKESILLEISTKSSMVVGESLVKSQDAPEWIDKSGKLLIAIPGDSELKDDPDILNHVQQLRAYDKFLLTLVGEQKLKTWVRSAAARALGQLSYLDKGMLNELLILARDEKVTAEVRSEAACALGKLGRVGEAIELCLALAYDDKLDAEARLIAVRTLSQFNHEAESVEVALVLAGDQSAGDNARFEAASLLNDLGHPKESEDLLIALARDERVKPYVRFRAMEAMDHLDVMNRKGEIFLALARDSRLEGWAGSRVMRVLGELSHLDEDILNELLVLARDVKVTAKVRSEAASELAKLGHVNEAIELSLALAGDENLDVESRLIAALTLGQFDHVAEGIEISLALTQDQSLKSWDRHRAYETLKRLLGDENSDGWLATF